MKSIKISIIYSSTFCDIEDLHLHTDDDKVIDNTKNLGEVYDLKELLLFLPFREKLI